MVLGLVEASAADTKSGALFLDAQETRVIILTLIKLVLQRPPTPVDVDITAAVRMGLSIDEIFLAS